MTDPDSDVKIKLNADKRHQLLAYGLARLLAQMRVNDQVKEAHGKALAAQLAYELEEVPTSDREVLKRYKCLSFSDRCRVGYGGRGRYAKLRSAVSVLRVVRARRSDPPFVLFADFEPSAEVFLAGVGARWGLSEIPAEVHAFFALEDACLDFFGKARDDLWSALSSCSNLAEAKRIMPEAAEVLGIRPKTEAVKTVEAASAPEPEPKEVQIEKAAELLKTMAMPLMLTSSEAEEVEVEVVAP